MTRRLGTSSADALAEFGRVLPDPGDAPLFCPPAGPGVVGSVRPNYQPCPVHCTAGTSIEAYRRSDLRGRLGQVLRLLIEADRTLDECCSILELEPNRLSGAFTKLSRLGLIIRSGRQRATRLNRAADVWTLATASNGGSR